MQLTQKETQLLDEMKSREQLCIQKYDRAAAQAADPQLKSLFERLSAMEKQHLSTLDSIASGTVPPTGQGGSQNYPAFSAVYSAAQTPDKSNDSYLCTDLLTAEKGASHLYDTCVFEFKDVGVRDAVNHIQKEEQIHGKMIYDYMAANSMY